MTYYAGSAPGPWGSSKGGRLTTFEFNWNNYDFATRLANLETNPVQPNQIAALAATGTTLILTMQDGSTFSAPYNPLLSRWMGEWAATTAYDALDFVTVSTVGLFGVLRDHTSALTFDAEATDIDGNLLYRKIIGYSGTTAGIADLVDVALASAADGDQLIYNGTHWVNHRARYIIGCATGGTMQANQNLLFHRFTKAVTIPADFGTYLGHTSQAGGSANATADTVITVSKAASASPTTFSSVGTITIGSGGVAPTFASSGGTTISFAQGDVLRLRGPSSADATLSDFFCTIVGLET